MYSVRIYPKSSDPEKGVDSSSLLTSRYFTRKADAVKYEKYWTEQGYVVFNMIMNDELFDERGHATGWEAPHIFDAYDRSVTEDLEDDDDNDKLFYFDRSNWGCD